MSQRKLSGQQLGSGTERPELHRTVPQINVSISDPPEIHPRSSIDPSQIRHRSVFKIKPFVPHLKPLQPPTTPLEVSMRLETFNILSQIHSRCLPDPLQIQLITVPSPPSRSVCGQRTSTSCPKSRRPSPRPAIDPFPDPSLFQRRTYLRASMPDPPPGLSARSDPDLASGTIITTAAAAAASWKLLPTSNPPPLLWVAL